MKVVVLATEEERGAGKPKALIKLCGVPLVRRLLYTLRAAGLRDVIVVTGPDGDELSRPSSGIPLRRESSSGQLVREAVGDGEDLGMRITYMESFPRLTELGDESFLVVEGNYILDERIIRELARGDGLIVACDSEPRQAEGVQVRVEGDRLQKIGPDLEESNGAYVGAALCNARVLPPLRGRSWFGCLSQRAQEGHIAALDVARIEPYVAGIRRRVKPFWFKVETEEDARLCKGALIEGAQKRTLDVLAWYFNRPIENWITYHIADLPITPNLMSILTYVVASLVALLLLGGRLLPASLLAFTVNVMDGLDGKLARVKGMATKLGHLEHSFDLLYEQSWYIALAWAVHGLRGDPLPLAIGFAAVLFDSFARHVSMQFRQVMGVALADYAPFDRLFRRFDGRRNIYTIYILLGAIFGAPLYALAAIAGHAVMTSAVYAWRAAKHLHAADRGVMPRELTNTSPSDRPWSRARSRCKNHEGEA